MAMNTRHPATDLNKQSFMSEQCSRVLQHSAAHEDTVQRCATLCCVLMNAAPVPMHVCMYICIWDVRPHAGAADLGVPLAGGEVARLMAYARSVAHFPTAVKEVGPAWQGHWRAHQQQAGGPQWRQMHFLYYSCFASPGHLHGP